MARTNSLVQPVNRTLELAFLECHASGHQWHHDKGSIGSNDPDPGPGLRAPFDQPAVGKRSHCISCTSERIRWMVRSGESTNKYRYADGYLHKRAKDDDQPAPTRREWNQQLVINLFDELDGRPQPRKAAKRLASVTRASA